MRKSVRFLTLWLSIGWLSGFMPYAKAQVFSRAEAQGMPNAKIAQKQTLKQVLNQLEKRFNVSFAFNERLIQHLKVNSDWQGDNLDQILDQLLSGSNLKYQKLKSNLYVIQENLDKAAPDKGNMLNLDNTQAPVQQSPLALTITGKVTDDTKEGLPGVSIVLKGTTNGTSTGLDGSYTLTIPDNTGTLVFTYIGYVPEEVPIQNQTVINVTLIPDIKTLSEVVVVGYGTQKQTDVTSSITRVEASQTRNLPVTGVEQALQGRAAGVQVTSNSGLPGSPITVRIRGIGSVSSSNDPLYIVDGVMVSGLNFLNPADVASYDILKDASAAAIYGSRAANGVVLITTKQGKTGKMQVSLDAYYGVNQPWRNFKPAGRDEYLYMVGQVNGQNTPEYVKAKAEYDQGYNTNWWKETVKPAPMQSYNLSVTGGTDKTHYAVSGSYLDQKGMLKPSGYQRTTFRVNTDYQLTNWLKMGESVSVSNEVTKNTIADVLNTAIQYDPLVPLIDPTKSPADQADPYNKYGVSSITFGSSPVARLARTLGDNANLRMVGNVFANINFLKNFQFSTNLGLDLARSQSWSFSPTYFMSASDKSDVRSASAGSSSTNHWLWTNTLNWSRELGDHSLTVLLGTSAESNKWTSVSGTRYGQLSNDPKFQYIDAATASDNNQVYGSAGFFTMNSYFGRFNYAYQGKYLLQASVRRDGSSNFSETNRWGTFPSVSAGWIISKENFWENVDASWFSNLKLRAGWGQLGNQSVPYAGQYVTLINGDINRRFVYGDGTIVQGFGLDNTGNSNLHWETSITTNIGLDMGFFNNALTFTAEYFNRETKDMIVAVPISSTFGLANPWINAGSVRNRGFDLSANYTGKAGDLNFSIGANVSHYNNKVLSLAGGQPYVEDIPNQRVSGYSRTAEGHPIGEFYGYQIAGIFQSQDEVNAYANGQGALLQPSARPGDFKFVDVAGAPDANGNPTGPDGKIDDNDKTTIGSPIPKLFYGVNLNLTYKAFDLTVFFQGNYGNKIFNLNRYLTQQPLGFANVEEGVAYAGWTPENHSNTHPVISKNDPNNNYARPSTFYIEDGSYLRLKNVQLGYSFSPALLKKMKITQLRIYVAAQNLLTFTPYKGFDPEVGATSVAANNNTLAPTNDPRASRLGTVDFSNLPQPRTLQVGVNFKF